jgi:Lon protease-like protein
VLFPKVLLPLRVFEPRFKQMLEDSLDTAGWMAVGLWQSAVERGADGNPDIFPVVGLGRVVDYRQADDGTYKIVLLGEHRVRVGEWVRVDPYPVATVREFSEREPRAEDRESIRGRLRARVKELVRKSVDSQVLMLLDKTIKECEEIGPLVDSIAYHFLSDAAEKQLLLEVADAEKREKLLIDILTRQRFGSSGGRGNDEPDAGDG